MTLYKNKSKSFSVAILDSAGVAQDLSGFKLIFTVRPSVDDVATAVISKEAVIATPASGIGVFSLTPSDTNVTLGDYVYDIQLTNESTESVVIVQPKALIIADPVRDAV